MNPPPTDLRKLSRALAANNARVMNFLDGLVTRVDEVVEATFDRDWQQVSQISQLIARYSQLRGFASIAQSATAVSDEAQANCNEAELRRRVLELIGACGRARKQQRTSVGDPVST
jgi:hypothetical protein